MSLEGVQTVLLRNKHNHRYLAVTSHYDQERNEVHVRSSDGSNVNISAGVSVGIVSFGVDVPLVSLNNAKWKLHLGSNGQYQIINFELDEPLYAGDDNLAYDKERRRVFTWRPRSYDYGSWRYWTLQESFNSYYTIKNVLYNEYLYAADYPSPGHVFTWREQNQDWMNDKFYWQLVNA